MSVALQAGETLTLFDVAPTLTTLHVALGWSEGTTPLNIDASAFALAENGHVRNDLDLVFYNNPRLQDGTVQLLLPTAADDRHLFALELNKMATTVHRIAFTLTIYEGQVRGHSFSQVTRLWIRFINPATQQEFARFEIQPHAMTETALIVAEVYRHKAAWRIRAVGQGFVGGLEPLATYYGVNVGEGESDSSGDSSQADALYTESVVTPQTCPATFKVDAEHLKQRILALEDHDAQLAQIVRALGARLERYDLERHRAQVALCLDIGSATQRLYRRSAMDEVVKRALALGFRFSAEGTIDLFLFGQKAFHNGTVTTANYRTVLSDSLKQLKLEGVPTYDTLLNRVRDHYRHRPVFGQQPILVLVVPVTDTKDAELAEQQLNDAASEGLFWQFLAIGVRRRKGFFSKRWVSDFSLLEKLSTRDPPLRHLHFSLLEDPAKLSDAQFIDLAIAGYPDWLTEATQKGWLRT